MPTSIPELIALEIVSRLLEITTESGYEFTVTEVVRPNRTGSNWLKRHFGIGVVQESSERNDELLRPGNPPAVAFDVTFSIHCVCRDSESESVPHSTNENAMVAAVQKALIDGDQSGWHTMGGNAVDTAIGSPVPYISPEGELNGASVPVVVTFRVSETDPYTVRA